MSIETLIGDIAGLTPSEVLTKAEGFRKELPKYSPKPAEPIRKSFDKEGEYFKAMAAFYPAYSAWEEAELARKETCNEYRTFNRELEAAVWVYTFNLFVRPTADEQEKERTIAFCWKLKETFEGNFKPSTFINLAADFVAVK